MGLKRNIYVMGSLRNPLIPEIGNRLRKEGHTAFEDWWGAGKIADDSWQAYENMRGRSYKEALKGIAANHIFKLDKEHLDKSDSGVLVMPAGKSAHLELGYLIGQGKPGYVLFDKEPERFDVMYLFAKGVFFDIEELVAELNGPPKPHVFKKPQPMKLDPAWDSLWDGSIHA